MRKIPRVTIWNLYIYIYGSSRVFATIVVSHQTSASRCLDEIIWNLNFWIIPLWQVWRFSAPLHTPVEEIMIQSAAWNYAMQTGRTKKGWKHLFRRWACGIQKCKSTTWSWKSNSCTAKRQSHHSPVSFQTPQCKRRIQYVISLSSLMVLPNLNAHASRPKILQNFAKFHWISSFCMVRSRKKQCSVSIFCCTLQCNRGTETI